MISHNDKYEAEDMEDDYGDEEKEEEQEESKIKSKEENKVHDNFKEEAFNLFNCQDPN